MGILDRMALTGKKAYVTGGAQGLGKAMATALAEAGADVAIVDINEDEAKATAAEIAKNTGRKLSPLRLMLLTLTKLKRWLKQLFLN